MFTHHVKIDKAPSYPIRVPERHSWNRNEIISAY